MSEKFDDGLTTGTAAVLFREKRWSALAPQIECIEVEVKPRTFRVPQHGTYENIPRGDLGKTVFMSWAEAHAGLLARRAREVDYAAGRLDRAKADLDKARAMKAPSEEAAQ